MRNSILFMVSLCIAVLSNTVVAGQSLDKGTEGTKPEPECDYITLPDSM